MKNDPYSRPANSNASTMYPGMDEIAGKVDRPEAKTGQEKPLVGFLFSVSRSATGEYWPLRIGNNTIGRSSDCDICLPEMTVSAHHAELNIRQMKTTKKLLVSLEVSGTNGGFVNEAEVGMEKMPCKNGDIITIGDNYVLYLIILDSNELGLKVSETFKPDETFSGNSGRFSPSDMTSNLYDPTRRAPDGTRTMGLDGNDGPLPGNTTNML